MKTVVWIVTCKFDEEFEATYTRLTDALAFMSFNGADNYELTKLVYDI